MPQEPFYEQEAAYRRGWPLFARAKRAFIAQ
jgi:hypothetical protein